MSWIKFHFYCSEVVLFRPKVMENKFEETAVKFTGDATKSSAVKSFLEEERYVYNLYIYQMYNACVCV